MPEPYENLRDYSWLMDHIILKESEQAWALGRLLFEYLHPQSVIDIGCGPGTYLLPFKSLGCTVRGVDGCPRPEGGKQLDDHEFEVVDLRSNWESLRRYDLALCIEVAEHLKEEYADHLVKVVANSATNIFWTAARPGQGGEGHYNMQPMEYWLEKFEKNGKTVHLLNSEIKDIIEDDPAYEFNHWIRWNGVLLE